MIGDEIMNDSIHLDSVLNRAQAGLDLARQVLDRIRASGSVSLDLTNVDRITPSFANAFVMTILDESGESDLPHSLTLLNPNDQVSREIAISVDRYARGLRLTTQLA